MSRNVKISAALVAVFALVVAVFALTSDGGDDEKSPPRAAATTTTQAAPPATTESAPAPGPGTTTPRTETAPEDPAKGAAAVVAPDPRTLGRPGDGKVTFTEFLDFECPACGAAYPLVEQLRQQYEGRVTFNIRYFPLPSHRNALPAALAVEAAAQQGKLVPMYSKMFQTQQQWGGQRRSQAKLFREFARELGLDMARYDTDVRSRETRRRVQRDLDAAEALQLSGTPSFFINEQPVTPQSREHLTGLLDDALAGKPLPAPTPPRTPQPRPGPDDPHDPDPGGVLDSTTEA
ncbi:MAG: thioredoxin domain-containing protein [Patulibacter sp.]|nr:thioredoxin domain-containing protein [Patulibacter sp.]